MKFIIIILFLLLLELIIVQFWLLQSMPLFKLKLLLIPDELVPPLHSLLLIRVVIWFFRVNRFDIFIQGIIAIIQLLVLHMDWLASLH